MWCGAKFVSADRGVRVFPHCTNHEMVAAMTSRQFIGQALRIFVVIGLVLGPISAVSSAAAMMHETMADDMPCRPLDQTTAPDCEASCPLMAVCTANCLPSVHAASGPVFGLKGVVIRPGVDVLLAPLSEQPPARPPRA